MRILRRNGRDVSITLVDDLDGSSEAEETVAFALDGDSYEIDLTCPHAHDLRLVFGRFVELAEGGLRAL